MGSYLEQFRYMVRKKVTVFMPAYNVAATLQKTVKAIPAGLVNTIVVVDDGSADDTAAVAQRLNLVVLRHPHNMGYGKTQRDGQLYALAHGADIVVMLHPDYQYDPKVLGQLIAPIVRGQADLTFGSRIRNKRESLAGGMPYVKYLLNRFYTTFQNWLLGAHLSEYFSGYRAFSRNLLETLPLDNFSDKFVYDQQLTVSALAYGFRVAEVAVPVRYLPDSSSMGFWKGVEFLLDTNRVLLYYVLLRCGLLRHPIFSYQR